MIRVNVVIVFKWVKVFNDIGRCFGRKKSLIQNFVQSYNQIFFKLKQNCYRRKINSFKEFWSKFLFENLFEIFF